MFKKYKKIDNLKIIIVYLYLNQLFDIKLILKFIMFIFIK